MTPVLLLARRNLLRHPARLLASVGGVALALSLTLALDAIYTGVGNGLTRYIDRAGADVWVAQSGVRNLHMVASWLPEAVTERVASVPGVRDATPILYSTDTVSAGGERTVAYVIGLPPDAAAGRPWDVTAGTGIPGPGEAIVDASFARRAALSPGSAVGVIGRRATVAALARGTATLLNSVAFVPLEDFRASRGPMPVISFVLVRVGAGQDPEAVAERIEQEVPGVTALTREAFAQQERRLVMDMSGDVIAIMDAVGFLVALVVVALTVYLATLSRRHEYGVLKALGADRVVLSGVVLAQAAISVTAGLLLAIAFTAALAMVVPLSGLGLEPAMSGSGLVRAGAVAAGIAALAALLPIHQVSGIDPAVVFRRGGAAR